MKTFTAKTKDIIYSWYLIDAKNQILGRLATKIAKYLQGKHKPEYTPNIDTGDYLIIINAKKILLSGNKKNNKIYYHHTGYIGGIKSKKFKEILKKNPEKIIKKAVKKMLPKGPLGRKMYKKLKVYASYKHNHVAQKPLILNI
ncbi:50S ribosomal protein L13 [Sodalis-like secondary symbiont of Drepanosiphum platanoidis]|uniref:50S ribosomal protein L13 n=1 Tax=Sodalis-like secondary symbiont of Drepanosiphum platanoidis TaxID=2994493 RepID=UPI00346488F5